MRWIDTGSGPGFEIPDRPEFKVPDSQEMPEGAPLTRILATCAEKLQISPESDILRDAMMEAFTLGLALGWEEHRQIMQLL